MKNVKQRKLLLVLPLLVIPFLTMGFWALGGGKKKELTDAGDKLNMTVPDADLTGTKITDKLGFYAKADKDSMKLEELMRSDPYFKNGSDDLFTDAAELPGLSFNDRLQRGSNNVSNPEAKVLQKLKLLEMEMNRAQEPVAVRTIDAGINDEESIASNEDEDLDQLNGTLEKILDIQHPERVKAKLQQSQPVTRVVKHVQRESAGDTLVNGFFGLSDAREIASHTAIEAVVHGNQSLVNGSVVKFRLLHTVYLNDKVIPAGSFVYGVAQLEGERLHVTISSVRSVKNLYDVQLTVYDMDGLPGIYVPGAITRDVAKQSADNSLSLLEMGSLDPSLKAQATAAGIGAAKSLLSRKVKAVKVQVKEGYAVLLKDKNISQ